MSINADEVREPEYYGALQHDQLLIHSVYASIQSEGPFAGYPAVFVRLGGCNLGDKRVCPFCAVDCAATNSVALRFDEVWDAIEDQSRLVEFRAGGHRKLVVITGGEPMIQPNLTQFLFAYSLMGIMPFPWHFQVESNGTVFLPIPSTGVHLLVSPKLWGNGHYKAPRPDVLCRTDALKFIVSDDTTSGYRDIPEWAWKWSVDKIRPIYVTPMTVYLQAPDATRDGWDAGYVDIGRTRANHRRARALAMKTGAILGMQMHLFTGGDG